MANVVINEQLYRGVLSFLARQEPVVLFAGLQEAGRTAERDNLAKRALEQAIANTENQKAANAGAAEIPPSGGSEEKPATA